MTLFCGIDWAEGHHDLAVVDADGKLMAKKRINEDVSGFAELADLLTELGDTAEDPIPVAIETPRACWSPHCGRPDARCSRSTRWPSPVIASDTRCPGPNPTTPTP
ncbi:hypothetical protein GCM10022380_89360 [Amycolatopsis tucumanensis]|uniref:Transposase IS110-like N-terminal domain-containing protein n=1 Tax=Amycolatopsis tucumanensis TaxID=401106 RepID=A0ABP7JY18_9PSEU